MRISQVLDSVTKIDDLKNYTFPLVQDCGEILTPKVKVGEMVKIGTVLADKTGDKLGGKLLSSISGKVVAIENTALKSGGEAKAILIENDFSEAKESMKSYKANKDDLYNLIKDFGLVDNDYPAYYKFANNEYDTFIIDLFDRESDFVSNLCYLKYETLSLIKAKDIICQIYKPQKVLCVINKLHKKVLKDKIDILQQNGIEVAFIKNDIMKSKADVIIKSLSKYSIDVNKTLILGGEILDKISKIMSNEPFYYKYISILGKPLVSEAIVQVRYGVSYGEIVLKLGGEIAPKIEYLQQKNDTINLYNQMCDMKEDFKLKENKEDEEFVKKFVELRKKTNSSIMELLKFEAVHKKDIFEKVYMDSIYNTGLVHYDLSVVKSDIGILLLNEKDANRKEKLYKKYEKKIEKIKAKNE